MANALVRNFSAADPGDWEEDPRRYQIERAALRERLRRGEGSLADWTTLALTAPGGALGTVAEGIWESGVSGATVLGDVITGKYSPQVAVPEGARDKRILESALANEELDRRAGEAAQLATMTGGLAAPVTKEALAVLASAAPREAVPATAAILAGPKRAGLYSKAAKVVAEKLPETFTPAQAAATLKNAGLKAEELDPVHSWLTTDAPAKISKGDLLEHIQEGLPKIKVVEHGGGNGKDWHVSIDENGAYQIVDEEGLPVDDFEFMSRAEAEQHLQETGGDRSHAPNRYAKYTLEGGENKRELLYQSPLGGDWSHEDLASARKFAIGERPGEARNWTDDEVKDYAAVHGFKPSGGGGHYVTRHWDEPDVLAHARVDDRDILTDGYVVENAKSGLKSPHFDTFEEAQAYQADLPPSLQTLIVKAKGRTPVLHIDELQSDLHQDARKKGYRAENEQRFRSLIEQRDKFPEDSAEYRQAQDQINKIARADMGVPDAPFKKTEAWTGFALKHLVQDAVARGKKAISWTTGAIQNDRYRLSNHIKELSYDPVIEAGEKKYILRARTAANGDMVVVNNGEAIAQKDLPDYVGTGLADRIVRGEGEASPAGTGRVLTGLENVNVGGHGMEKYYDGIVASTVKKLFGPYGAKVEKATPAGVKAKIDPQVAEAAKRKFWESEKELGDQYQAAVAAGDPDAFAKVDGPRQAALKEYKATLDAATKVPEVHVMRITPELAEAAQNEGFTLYAGGKRGVLVGAALARANRKYGLEQPMSMEERMAAEGAVPEPPPHGASDEEMIRYLRGAAALVERRNVRPTLESGVDVAEGNKLGFAPYLRVKVPDPGVLPEKPLITQATTNRNAPAQLDNIDEILRQHANPTRSPVDWSRMMATAFASDEVPVPPYAFIEDINGDGAAAKISSLTPGQIADADHGFAFGREMREAYENGELSPVETGKLFLWSFLSRGVSPYTQEGLFIDAFEGADEWIQKAAHGDFTEADLPAYLRWTATVAPKGSGQPGAGAIHNLNAFGTNFLLKMSARDANGDSNLQRLHDMLSDPSETGARIRREFMKFGEGVGIDNKVVSFTMLVAGHPDVMVIDRVQTRQLWDDGRFADRNIYDGQKNDEGKVITGTPLANLTYGARGLLVYEAIERALTEKIGDIYRAAGRPQDASIGRYHWESWVAYSQQEASHGSLGAILGDVKRRLAGSAVPAIAAVSAKQGEYGAYEYGTRYARDASGTPYFTYATPTGGSYEFSVPAFRQFLEDVKKPKFKVVPKDFKVTESGNAPWFQRPEVNREALDRLAASHADRRAQGEGAGAVQEAGQDQMAGRSERGADWQNDPIVAPPGVRLTPVDHNPFAGGP